LLLLLALPSFVCPLTRSHSDGMTDSCGMCHLGGKSSSLISVIFSCSISDFANPQRPPPRQQRSRFTTATSGAPSAGGRSRRCFSSTRVRGDRRGAVRPGGGRRMHVFAWQAEKWSTLYMYSM
jgi:hypothetical protein